jgi:hypothetical protein
VGSGPEAAIVTNVRETRDGAVEAVVTVVPSKALAEFLAAGPIVGHGSNWSLAIRSRYFEERRRT